MNRCNNCHVFGHLKINCPLDCIRCLQPSGVHNCVALPFRRAVYDRAYIRRREELFNDVQRREVRSHLPVDIVDSLLSRFANRAEQNVVSTFRDNAFVSHALKEPLPTGNLILGADITAQNAVDLCTLVEGMHLKKYEAFGRIRHAPITMKVVRRVAKMEMNYVRFRVELHFDVRLERMEILKNLRNLTSESFFMLNDPTIKDGRTECKIARLREDRDAFVVQLREDVQFPNLNPLFDKTGTIAAANTKHLTLSFDYGSGTLLKHIQNIRRCLELATDEHMIMSPPWLLDHLLHFETTINEAHAPYLSRYPQTFNPNAEFYKFMNEARPGTQFHASQHHAIMCMLRQQFVAVKGPPGCGKTFTMAWTIIFHAFVLRHRILVLASRNHTADDITITLLNALKAMPHEFCSVYGIDPKSFVVRAFSNNRHLHGIDVPNEAISFEHEAGKLSRFKVVVTTVGHSVVSSILSFPADVLCIDEAGLVDPIEFLGSICARHVASSDSAAKSLPSKLHEQLFIVGDPHQMAPRYGTTDVMSEKAQYDCGLDISFLTRIFRNVGLQNANNITPVLSQCQRGPVSIFEPVFALFYPPSDHLTVLERLGAGIEVDSSHKYLPTGIRLKSIYVCGPPNSDAIDNTSRSNMKFLGIARDIIQHLLLHGWLPGGIKIEPSDIMYITPYLAQLRHARLTLPEGVLVKTFDSCQGLQAPITVVDFVKTGRNFAFMGGQTKVTFGEHQNGRCVVGLSRSTDLRIVIANADLLDNRHDLRRFQNNQKDSAQKDQSTLYYNVQQ